MVGSPGLGQIHAGRAPARPDAAADRGRGAGNLDDPFARGPARRGRHFAHPALRAPHHTASMAAIVGGGRGAKPGEISLAHNGVLFLDEFPEYPAHVLETLRQPIETGEVVVARANAHVTYPCRFLLMAAANPCRCGHLYDRAGLRPRAPSAARTTWAHLGAADGPVRPAARGAAGLLCATSTCRRGRTSRHRGNASQPHARAGRRFAASARTAASMPMPKARCWTRSRRPDAGERPAAAAADRFRLTARGYHRILRLARTIADLDGADDRRPISPRRLAIA
jgi:magnesium chelatase family protein